MQTEVYSRQLSMEELMSFLIRSRDKRDVVCQATTDLIYQILSLYEVKKNNAVSLLLKYLRTLPPVFNDVNDDDSITVAANSIREIFQGYSNEVANMSVVQLLHAPSEARTTIIFTTFAIGGNRLFPRIIAEV